MWQCRVSSRILPSRQITNNRHAYWKNLVNKFNPTSYFPTPKICHLKFDPVSDPNRDITLRIEEIKFCMIIPGNWDPLHLPNPTSSSRIDSGMQWKYQWNAAGECRQGNVMSHGDVNNINMRYFYHCSYGTFDTYKRSSGTSSFHFIVVIKESLFTSKF